MRKRYTGSGLPFFLKDESVDFQGTEQQYQILEAAAPIYQRTPQRLVVTSAADGQHMEDSLHYEDKALDLRVWHLDDHEAVAERLQKKLGNDYDVIAEWRAGEDGEKVPSHIHAEYDPA